MDVLRAILAAATPQQLAGSAGEGHASRLPYLAGGIAFDYLATFEELPPVPESLNRFPDYQFLLADVLLVEDHTSRTAILYGYDADLWSPTPRVSKPIRVQMPRPLKSVLLHRLPYEPRRFLTMKRSGRTSTS